LETIINTEISEEDLRGGILVVQVLLTRKIYKGPPAIRLYNNKKLINT
jgi:hypothetical protein